MAGKRSKTPESKPRKDAKRAVSPSPVLAVIAPARGAVDYGDRKRHRTR